MPEYVAGLSGATPKEISWRKPFERWNRCEHDTAVNDFRIAMTQACSAHPELTLTEWIPERVFWRETDRITFSYTRGGKSITDTRGVRPDGYFVVQQPGYSPSRFLFELDRATEDHPRFIHEKLHAGVAYIKSPAYKQRFGYNAGRWLVVTSGEWRMRNLQEKAALELGGVATVFYFTTIDHVRRFDRHAQQATYHDVLTAAIWYQGASATPTTLFKSYTRTP